MPTDLLRFAPVLALLAVALPVPGGAHVRQRSSVPGRLVDVSITVDGRHTPLYRAPDGSGRWYLEARHGAHYAVRVTNRSQQRLGVMIEVDGLNVISGRRDGPTRQPGRMYVLAARDDVTVRGWRTSLQDVHSFTFVDERDSYAARSGKANAKMGWIEVKVYREQHAHVSEGHAGPVPLSDQERERRRPPAAAGEGRSAGKPVEQDAPRAPEALSSGRARHYPGTGWGSRSDDRAVRVHFDPEAHPTDTLTLRYEYRAGLLALGIRPHHPHRDRLAERDRGREGFVQPPRW